MINDNVVTKIEQEFSFLQNDIYEYFKSDVPLECYANDVDLKITITRRKILNILYQAANESCLKLQEHERKLSNIAETLEKIKSMF